MRLWWPLHVQLSAGLPEFARALYAEVEHFCSEAGDSGVALRLEHIHGLDKGWLRRALHGSLSCMHASVVVPLLQPVVDRVLQALNIDDTPKVTLLPKVMRYTAQGNADWPVHCDGSLLPLLHLPLLNLLAVAWPRSTCVWETSSKARSWSRLESACHTTLVRACSILVSCVK